MEKMIVFGATGKVGSKVVEYALKAGYEVTAFVRSSEGYPINHPHLSFYVGNALDPLALEKALTVHSVVISALGTKSIDQPITLMSDAMGNIVDIMKEKGIKRVLTVGGAGILHESGGKLMKDNPAFPANLQNVSSDHLRVYELLSGSSLDWTIVCPPYILEGEKGDGYLLKADYFPEEGKNEVKAGSVADFLIKESKENQYVKRRVGIAERK